MILFVQTGGTNSFVQFLTALLVFLFVLALTYFTVRWVGTYQKVQAGNKNFEVIETCKVTTNKYMQIIKVGSRYFLIGIGKDDLTYFTELDAEDLDLSPNAGFQDNFQKLLQKAKDKMNRRGNGHE
ncbi:MAG: flagellar biosynthetic protein FliO [Lachnospiraceae bacterium]|nr:flagellar biosynthetic protein FliO [Lachnospiraceae bacterium]